MSYKLSVSQGSSKEIADAAVASCENEISDIAISYHKGPEMPSIAQIQQMTEITQSDLSDYAKSARTWVIQSRAGNCSQVVQERK